MGKWETMYRNLEERGLNIDEQLAGTTWLDQFIPQFGQLQGKMLDLGCGLGADMLRCASLGYEPYGLDLEDQAIRFVIDTYGFAAKQHDLNDPLPFEDETFVLVLSRLTIHYLDRERTTKLFAEVRRVLKPSGRFLFMVNSETHRKLGLQYDYSDAVQVEPQRWHLPNDMDRTFLFYTTELAREMLGDGWRVHHLKKTHHKQWGIEKRPFIGLVQKN